MTLPNPPHHSGSRDDSMKRALQSRLLLLLCTLLPVFAAHAQQEYYEGSITHADRQGQRIWLHNGEPLQGSCKINFMDIDLAARYSLSDYRDGVRSDTVSYYTARSNTLLRTEVRLGANARHIYDYTLYNGSFLREWTEVDGHLEGSVKEWYAEGKPRLEETFKEGERNGPSREWDKEGRMVSACVYRDEVLDGEAKTWRYEGTDWGEVEIAYHRQRNAPYMIERFAFADGQQGLIERIVPDSEGATLYRASKQECDTTRIDTLYGARMMVEIRDFREGRIRSLERYDASSYFGTLIPHGVFELYAPDGGLGTRMLYEEGRLIVSRDYDEEQTPQGVVTTTLLSREDGDRLLAASCDSKYFDQSDETRPLCIRNRKGEVLLERDEEERRYEYHGYDPNLKLHVGFSSVGSWNDIRWYVVYESDDVESVLELREELFAVNGTTGVIASGVNYFEDELELSVYRRIEDEDAGGFFELVFWITLPEVPEPIWDMHWLGDNSLLLVMEKSCLRVDIAPESLAWQEEEPAEC